MSDLGTAPQKRSTWYKFKLVVGGLLVAAVAIGGVRDSLLQNASNPLFSDIAAGLFAVGVVLFISAILYGTSRVKQISTSALANPGDIALEPLRLRSTLAAASFTAFLPQCYLWAYESLSATGHHVFKLQMATWALFIGMAFLDLILVWGMIRNRAPVLIDWKGIQYADQWIGVLPWRDIKDVRLVQAGRSQTFTIELYEPSKLQLQKRSYLLPSARFDDGKLLLSLPSIGSLIQVEAMVKIMQDRIAKYGRKDMHGR